jgi:hypothetical protein
MEEGKTPYDCSQHKLIYPPNQFNSASRLTALRFKKEATLPVRGSTNILVPVTLFDATPMVGGKAVQVGSYVHLTKDVVVVPGFYCLLLKPQ